VGGAEILAGQIDAFVERARGEGVDVTHEVAPGMIHDWHMLAGIHAPSQDAIDSIGRFVRARTARRRPLDIQEERC
jgi:acetyl esterase/lipase